MLWRILRNYPMIANQVCGPISLWRELEPLTDLYLLQLRHLAVFVNFIRFLI